MTAPLEWDAVAQAFTRQAGIFRLTANHPLSIGASPAPARSKSPLRRLFFALLGDPSKVKKSWENGITTDGRARIPNRRFRMVVMSGMCDGAS